MIFPNGGVSGFTVIGFDSTSATANLAFKLGFNTGTSNLAITFPSASTWTGAGTGPGWYANGDTNWAYSEPQSSADAAIVFTGTAQTASVQNVAAPFQLHTLFFAGTLGGPALSGSGLDFHESSGSLQPRIVQDSPNPVTISNDMAFAATTLTCGGSGSMTFSGNLSGGELVKVGSGLLTLTGSNSYGGGTTVLGGTLIVTNPAALADGSNMTIGNASAFPAPIVGTAVAPASPVPEPGTLVLLAAAAALIARKSARRRRWEPRSGDR